MGPTAHPHHQDRNNRAAPTRMSPNRWIEFDHPRYKPPSNTVLRPHIMLYTVWTASIVTL